MDLPRYLHVYNRGLDKRTIFPDDSYYQRFMVTSFLSRLKLSPKPMLYFKREKLGLLPKSDGEAEKAWGPPLVDVLSYCLMPNHFHFLLKEREERGVSKFMQRLGNGYTKYFNARQEREGRLFTAKYKFVQIRGNEQLIHVSRYIHTNPCMSSYTNVSISDLPNYPWSSLQNFLKVINDLYCQPEEVLGFFNGTSGYWDFVSLGMGDSFETFPPEIFIDAN